MSKCYVRSILEYVKVREQTYIYYIIIIFVQAGATFLKKHLYQTLRVRLHEVRYVVRDTVTNSN